MKKLMILCAACLTALCAMAQTIDAIKVTQNGTTDWYRFGESSRIDVIIDDLGNPEFPGGTMYDLSLDGNVETVFGTAPAEKITLTAADFTVTKDGDWTYDQTEKRVNVEFISVENPGPPADKVEIYYNNDKMVKPIEPGTYQVYIDIRETDTYAAVTGITSDAWKFTIVAPVPEWITVRDNMTVGTYGTLCWNYNLTDIDGAELYAIAGIENDRVILEEVLAEETQAGAGYVIRATAKSLRVKNGDQYTDTPLPAAECNGLQGTFADIVDGAVGTAGNILEGNYIVYNNEWCLCGGYTGLLANRAYLIMNYVPGGTVTQAPNRKYISMPLPKETPTDLNRFTDSPIHRFNKYIINGQFMIVRDNKMYNAQGIEL